MLKLRRKGSKNTRKYVFYFYILRIGLEGSMSLRTDSFKSNTDTNSTAEVYVCSSVSLGSTWLRYCTLSSPTCTLCTVNQVVWDLFMASMDRRTQISITTFLLFSPCTYGHVNIVLRHTLNKCDVILQVVQIAELIWLLWRTEINNECLCQLGPSNSHK